MRSVCLAICTTDALRSAFVVLKTSIKSTKHECMQASFKLSLDRENGLINLNTRGKLSPNVQLDQLHSALTIATVSKAHPSPVTNVHSAFVNTIIADSAQRCTSYRKHFDHV